MSTPLPEKPIKIVVRGVEESPLFSFNKGNNHKKGGNFYFGLFSLVLFGFLFFSSPGLAQLDSFGANYTVVLGFVIKDATLSDSDSLFFNSTAGTTRETPDLKTSQDGFAYGASPSHIVTTQTYATVTSGSTQTEERKEIIDDYEVEENETITFIAGKFNVTPQTIAETNGLSVNATLKVGQKLIILPVDGILYTIRSGDTISEIAKNYKIKEEDILVFNEINNDEIFQGDALILPGAKKPIKITPKPVQIVLPNTFFLSPLLRAVVTQGLHPDNAVDLGAPCGAPIYAAMSGVVRVAGFNKTGGNRVIIENKNGVGIYNGHMKTIVVKTGDQVVGGDRIGTVGKTGKATGCHVHFQVHGAKNPFATYFTGSVINVNN